MSILHNSSILEMIQEKKAQNHQFQCCTFHQTLACRGLSQGCTDMNGSKGSHPLSFIWPGHHGHHGHPNGHTLAWNIQPFSVARLLLHTQTCQTLDPSASRTSKKGRHWNGVKYLTLMFTMQWLNFECPCSNVWICPYVSFSILWSLQCITQKCRVIPQIPCLTRALYSLWF